MIKTILIHANCHNSKAKGDFAFAANIAKDVVHELQSRGETEIKVILVSTLDGIPRFESMYGKAVDGQITVEGTSLGLCSLEEFDAVENQVIAFIDANRCKYSTTDLIKRIISPESKFLFVGNVNQSAFSDLFNQSLYLMEAKRQQPGLYDFFNSEDMLIGSAGLGSDRLGLPTITKAEDLPLLSSADQAMVPEGEYGFMYLAAINPDIDYKLIAQYIKLSGQDKYVLVGNFETNQSEIQFAYEHDKTLLSSKPFPQIEYHQALPSGIMRQATAHATSSLVLSTGVTSTLEAMQDSKLTYYQDLSQNSHFVEAYLIAVKSIVSSDSGLFGAMPQLIIELSNLLFAQKPLIPKDMERTHELLELHSINSRLVQTNQAIIAQASGKIATKLLSFLEGPRKTKELVQLANVCAALRKPGETGSPVYDQALRRAATWGRLFELHVLIKAMPKPDLNKTDPTHKRTALHFAASNKNVDCVRALIHAEASLDIQDADGQTPLHKAVINGDRHMIKVLIEAGASIDIPDKMNHPPSECAPDQGTIAFIQDCHSHIHFSNLRISA